MAPWTDPKPSRFPRLRKNLCGPALAGRWDDADDTSNIGHIQSRPRSARGTGTGAARVHALRNSVTSHEVRGFVTRTGELSMDCLMTRRAWPIYRTSHTHCTPGA